MRTELEVDLAHPDESDPAATHRSLLEETIGLQHLVEDLLALARLDAGATPTRSAPVDLEDVVRRELARVGDPGGVEIRSESVSPAAVTGDTDQLTRAVRNLVENAVGHARSVVTVSLGEVNDGVLLTVADDGPGIPSDQRDASSSGSPAWIRLAAATPAARASASRSPGRSSKPTRARYASRTTARERSSW